MSANGTSPDPTVEQRHGIIKDHLASLAATHKSVQEWWRALDQKAQWTTGISTFLLGAGFWVAEHRRPDQVLEAVVIIVVLALLLAGLALSVWAMMVRDTVQPPDAGWLDTQVRAILGAAPDEHIVDRIQRFEMEQAGRWIASITDDITIGRHKGRIVRISQWLLLTATGLIALLAASKAVVPEAPPAVALPVTGKPGPPGPIGPEGRRGVAGPRGPRGMDQCVDTCLCPHGPDRFSHPCQEH